MSTAMEIAEITMFADPFGPNIKLRTADGVICKVCRAIAEQMGTVKHNLADREDVSETIPLLEVKTVAHLTKILEYCREAVKQGADWRTKPEGQEWCKVYADEISQDRDNMFEIMMAANYLEQEPLVKLLCKKTADMIRGKSGEEIKQFLGFDSL